MPFDWETYRERCYTLYIEQGATLDRVMELLESCYGFKASKRVFQEQFRRWNFPCKSNPAYTNEALVAHIGQLWKKNVSQRNMLPIPKAEGFDVGVTELNRLRKSKGWSLRAALNSRNSSEEPPPPSQHIAAPQPAEMTADLIEGTPEASRLTLKRRRNRIKTDASGVITRFPSEMTLEEAKLALGLEQAPYVGIRTRFQHICAEQGVTKKTEPGLEKWDELKARLTDEVPELQEVIATPAQDNNGLDKKLLALDVICTDVTKRMRMSATHTNLCNVKNILGVNPDEARQMRSTLIRVLQEDDDFDIEGTVTTQKLADLRLKWAEQEELVMRCLKGESSGHDVHDKIRALDILARDVLKRQRGHLRKARIDQGISNSAGQVQSSDNGPSNAQAADDALDLGFDNDVPTQVSYPHVAQVPFGSQQDASMYAESDSHFSVPYPPSFDGSLNSSLLSMNSTLGTSMSRDTTVWTSLDTQSLSTSMDMPMDVGGHLPFEPCMPAPLPLPPPASDAQIVCIRPSQVSSFAAIPEFWLATMESCSIKALRRAAVESLRGQASCTMVWGIVTGTDGAEVPLLINTDQDLRAYMALLVGMAAPMFNVHLLWRSAPP